MSLKKKEIKAVHTHDLGDLLRKYNQYDKFVENKISCYVCGETINENNMTSLKLLEHRLEFTCGKASCYDDAIKHKVSA